MRIRSKSKYDPYRRCRVSMLAKSSARYRRSKTGSGDRIALCADATLTFASSVGCGMMMKVAVTQIRLLSGKEIIVENRPWDSVAWVKKLIARKERLVAEAISLVYGGEMLVDATFSHMPQTGQVFSLVLVGEVQVVVHVRVPDLQLVGWCMLSFGKN